MPLKHRHRPKVKHPTTGISVKKNSGIVDAVIFQQINLSLCLKLQNLFDFFVDSLYGITISSGNQTQNVADITRCLKHIEDVFTENMAIIGGELHNLLTEFLEDGHHFTDFIETVISTTSDTDTTTYQNTIAKLTAKTSHLRWLSVCILQEMKMAYLCAFFKR